MNEGVHGDVSNLGDLDRLFDQIKREKGTLALAGSAATAHVCSCGASIAGRVMGRAGDDLMPSPVQHATLPLVGKSKGLSTARAPFREQGVVVNDDAKLPLSWPRHERATCVVVQAPHRPQCADVARCVLACGCR